MSKEQPQDFTPINSHGYFDNNPDSILRRQPEKSEKKDWHPATLLNIGAQAVRGTLNSMSSKIDTVFYNHMLDEQYRDPEGYKQRTDQEAAYASYAINIGTTERREKKERRVERKEKAGKFLRRLGRAAMMLPGVYHAGMSLAAMRVGPVNGQGVFKQVGTVYKDTVRTIMTDKPKRS